MQGHSAPTGTPRQHDIAFMLISVNADDWNNICHVFVESKSNTHLSQLLSGWKMEMYVIILEISVIVCELHH